MECPPPFHLWSLHHETDMAYIQNFKSAFLFPYWSDKWNVLLRELKGCGWVCFDTREANCIQNLCTDANLKYRRYEFSAATTFVGFFRGRDLFCQWENLMLCCWLLPPPTLKTYSWKEKCVQNRLMKPSSPEQIINSFHCKVEPVKVERHL